MALATVFRRSDDGEGGWRLSLTARILAVNIFALIVLAGGFFYLDSFRTQRCRDFSGVGACAAGKVIEAAQHRHVGKTGRLEQAEVILLDQGTDDAFRPKLWIGFGALADRLRYDDVRDLHSAARA